MSSPFLIEELDTKTALIESAQSLISSAGSPDFDAKVHDLNEKIQSYLSQQALVRKPSPPVEVSEDSEEYDELENPEMRFPDFAQLLHAFTAISKPPTDILSDGQPKIQDVNALDEDAESEKEDPLNAISEAEAFLSKYTGTPQEFSAKIMQFITQRKKVPYWSNAFTGTDSKEFVSRNIPLNVTELLKKHWDIAHEKAGVVPDEFAFPEHLSTAYIKECQKLMKERVANDPDISDEKRFQHLRNLIEK